MGYWLLPIVEEGIRSPDLAGEQVVKWKDLHRPIKLQPLIPPTLPEEHINRVLLEGGKRKSQDSLTALLKLHFAPHVSPFRWCNALLVRRSALVCEALHQSRQMTQEREKDSDLTFNRDSCLVGHDWSRCFSQLYTSIIHRTLRRDTALSVWDP